MLKKLIIGIARHRTPKMFKVCDHQHASRFHITRTDIIDSKWVYINIFSDQLFYLIGWLSNVFCKLVGVN